MGTCVVLHNVLYTFIRSIASLNRAGGIHYYMTFTELPDLWLSPSHGSDSGVVAT